MSNSNADTFRILIATDNHLGYCEKDPVRRDDSFTTFEEILSQAKNLKVDFILLGGDLFHENKPSRFALHNCLKLLRQYCLGNDPVQFEFLSDQNDNFKHNTFPVVNYEDPNFNVSIPVFTIHGNHDDPTGGGFLSSMDLLSVSGLVNYFGKCVNLDDIAIAPLLMQKGKTKLALYGLGAIRDERLHRAFLANKVKMLRPREELESWFNIFVLHQNRARHGATNYIPETFLDDFLDLVLWGHEHECRIDPEQIGSKEFFITQPGSSVATSLCAAEAKPKNIALLEVCNKQMRLTPIHLETVRQFYFDDIVLKETSLNLSDGNSSKKVMDYCSARIQELLEKAELEHTGNPQQPKVPLIRLKVEYEEAGELFSQHRFGHKFVNLVANPKDMVIFQKKRKEMKKDNETLDDDAARLAFRMENLEVGNITAVDLVKEYFESAEDKKKMILLTEKTFGEAIQEFVDKEEREAINEFVKFQVRKCQKYLKSKKITNEDDVDQLIDRFREENRQSGNDAFEMQEVLREARKKANQTKDSDDEMVTSDIEAMDDDSEREVEEPKRGRGRGRGRARVSASKGSTSTRKPRAQVSSLRGRGSRGTKKPTAAQTRDVSSFFSQSSRNRNDNVDDDNDDEVQVISKKPRMSTRKRPHENQKGISFFDDDDDDGADF